MKQKTIEFISNKNSTDKVEWINKNYAQLNLLISSIFWVSDVEEVFK